MINKGEQNLAAITKVSANEQPWFEAGALIRFIPFSNQKNVTHPTSLTLYALAGMVPLTTF